MKKTLLLGVVVLVMMSSTLMAAPIACPTTGSMATLLALDGTGCLINGLLFSSFTFTPSATGSGMMPTAAQMTYTLDDPGTSTGTGQLIYGFEFNPDLSLIGVVSEDILINYTIMAPSPMISSIHVLENATVTTGGTAIVSEGPDRGCTGADTGCTFLPIVSVTPANPHQDLLGIGPFTELDVSKDINVTGSTANSIAAISQVRDSVDLAVTVPEPAAYILVGACLLGLTGLVRIRKTSPK